MILVDASALTASRPGKPLFDGLSLTLSSGDRLAVVGLNGCGKSTLLRALAGATEPEGGTVRRGSGTRVVMLDQHAVLPEQAATVRAAAGEGWEAESVLDRLGMGALLDAPVATLSGGQAKRVALARALVEVGPGGGPDDDAVLLLLDEPTNHLDLDAVAWLEDRLAAHRGGLVLVTHDRHVLDRVTNRIVELDRGRPFVHQGGYAAYLEAKAERDAKAATAETVRRNLARQELAWLRRGAPARSTKPKARMAAATAVVGGRAEAPARASDDLPLHFGTPRLGDRVVELHGVGHRFGAGPWLFRHVDLLLDNRERLGVVGPNGAGKSTLIDIVSGCVAPGEGHVARGTTVRIGSYDQHGAELDPGQRVRDAVAGPARTPDWQDARLLDQFWFSADTQRAPIGLLSGGERRRLQLLLTLAAKPNVLLLDEPTNDLDLDTLRVLEDFLDDWPGALLVVSHDRAFLERTVTDVVVIDGDHDVARVPGGFAAWEAQRRSGRTHGRATPTAAPVATTAATSAATTTGEGPLDTAGTTKRSLSTLRHLLRAAERDLRRLEHKRDQLVAALGAATGTEDHEALARVGHELAGVESQLAGAEEHWLSLAEEAELNR